MERPSRDGSAPPRAPDSPRCGRTSPLPLTDDRIKVLLTNREGVTAEGTRAMAAALTRNACFDVRVAAPLAHAGSRESPAVGDKLLNCAPSLPADDTVYDLSCWGGMAPLGVGDNASAADCVQLVLNSSLLGRWRPHVVVVGISSVAAVGRSVHASAAVAAAREAVMASTAAPAARHQGVLAIAVGLDSCTGSSGGFARAAAKMVPLIAFLASKHAGRWDGAGGEAQRWPPATVLNVNVPDTVAVEDAAASEEDAPRSGSASGGGTSRGGGRYIENISTAVEGNEGGGAVAPRPGESVDSIGRRHGHVWRGLAAVPLGISGVEEVYVRSGVAREWRSVRHMHYRPRASSTGGGGPVLDDAEALARGWMTVTPISFAQPSPDAAASQALRILGGWNGVPPLTRGLDAVRVGSVRCCMPTL